MISEMCVEWFMMFWVQSRIEIEDLASCTLIISLWLERDREWLRCYIAKRFICMLHV